ncbi:MAG: hypothetical protein ACOCTT_01745, partial [archaeon]
VKRISKSLITEENPSIGYKRKPASKPLSKKEGILLDEDEIGECGLYSFSILSNFNIKEPVGYIKLDLASIIAQGLSLSSQRVLYPQLTGGLVLTDGEISDSLKIDKKPFTKFGESIKGKIRENISRERIKGSSGSSKLFETNFKERNLQVWVLKDDETTSDGLFSEVYVWNGSLYAVPKANVSDALRRVKEEGHSTGISLIDSISSGIAWEIEHMDKKRKFIDLGEINSLESANINLPRNLRGQIHVGDFEADLNLKLELRLFQSN